jgi:asparagine synthase (glutamine-hydrolysing)
MCGIAGVLYAQRERQPDRQLLRRMADTLAHRGPDGEGFWAGRGVGLAHRRLSIIDLAGGAQPIANEDRTVHVVLNGEIYNHASLRASLAATGHRFATRSDTEVIVHLYEEHGEAFVERLRGMFAIALWDVAAERLVLARDRVGLKPLYVYRDEAKVVFGSEIKALLAHPGVARELDTDALDDYLAYGMIAGPRTIFRRVAKLPPAHTWTFDGHEPTPRARRYWSLSFAPDPKPSIDEWAEAIEGKLHETVAAHLAADVPVGAFLSGGIDSTLIVSSAARQMSGEVQTFSMGFTEARFDELPFARIVARAVQTRHSEELATVDAVSLLDTLTRCFDEPFADPSMLPTYLVSRLARRSVKVVLSGDGGDEAFGGYVRYAKQQQEARVRRLIPGWARRTLVRRLGAVWPDVPLLADIAGDAAVGYANATSTCRLPLRRRLLSPDVVRSLNGFVPGRQMIDAQAVAPPSDIVAGAIAADVAVRLPDRYLVKVDRASMAHGLEVRPPFLDHELLELAARIPSNLKVRGGRPKWILKRAGRTLLPGEIARRGKQGFDMPIGEWLRGPLRPLVEARLLTSGSPVADLIDRGTVARLFESHRAGRVDGRHPLWALLVLASWASHYR